jgi:hypothetical protein
LAGLGTATMCHLFFGGQINLSSGINSTVAAQSTAN